MTIITKDNGFDLNIRWRFPDGRKYTFTFIALFVFLIIIYGNSFHCAWQFDDRPNIVENKHIFLKTLDWPDIKKTFYAPMEDSISRPLSYLSFALNYYLDELNVFGYHLVNFIIHYLSSVFLFLFIYNTLRLPAVRERYGPASYGETSVSGLHCCISNRFLTFIENILLGAKLSEYHTGYRAFSRELLDRLPLDANSDDFVFDNQMLAQIIWSGYTIAEVSCPTRYSAESSSINLRNSIKYGIGCVLTALTFRLAKMKLIAPGLFLDER